MARQVGGLKATYSVNVKTLVEINPVMEATNRYSKKN